MVNWSTRKVRKLYQTYKQIGKSDSVPDPLFDLKSLSVSSLKSCVTADTFFASYTAESVWRCCVALQNGWIYPRIISLCLSTSQQCLHKHGSFESTDRGKWVQYTKPWFGRWCLQSDGHRRGALSSADVSSNRESGSFVRDMFINC